MWWDKVVKRPLKTIYSYLFQKTHYIQEQNAKTKEIIGYIAQKNT